VKFDLEAITIEALIARVDELEAELGPLLTGIKVLHLLVIEAQVQEGGRPILPPLVATQLVALAAWERRARAVLEMT